jgi:hypothetical protein
MIAVGTGTASHARWFYSHYTGATMACGFFANDWTPNNNIDTDTWTLLHWVSEGSNGKNHLYKNGAEILHPQGRPDSLPSITDKIKTGFGNLYVTISFHNQKPFEVFASIGKSGYSTMADAEALGRLISTALRSGVEAEEVITQLKGIGGSEPIFTEGGLIQSIPDAIAKVLEKHFGEVKHNAKDFYTVRCKICGALLPDEKCPVCNNCGWSKCA